MVVHAPGVHALDPVDPGSLRVEDEPLVVRSSNCCHPRSDDNVEEVVVAALAPGAKRTAAGWLREPLSPSVAPRTRW